ncbi:hypothetical protein G210_4229 [Candida maltosa Xu316]|uniref:DUF300-domain-containing protein n=1 Tax=Candida maltosa (strain Xu316) TaxID=1245528 RepID=M3HS99_CANMX|nr:hypothetical protein G210_4229 [Candida maltosa Xu316]
MFDYDQVQEGGNQNSIINKYFLEPFREVYEAFVIYTFFSLLNDMLGGERNIIIMTTGRAPVSHPGFLGKILPKLDISDPFTFLNIKRGILQYVWLKPFICISILIFEFFGWYNVNDLTIRSVYFWLTLIYNVSVSLSLYCLAIFWKILYDDLKPFKPIGKFLCVKLIIFASYWQGIILAILAFLKLLPGSDDQGTEGKVENIGICIQNALLCVELIGFSIGHWTSFSYYPFTMSQLPYGRLEFIYALKDCLGVKDLVSDFKLTFYGDYYQDYKTFDSVEANLAHPDSKSRMSRIHQGLRYHYDGKHKHWLPDNASTIGSTAIIPSTSEIHALDNSSIISNNNTMSSVKGLYSNSPKGSPPNSPRLSTIQDVLVPLSNDDFDADDDFATEYIDEDFKTDELLYNESIKVINNYKLQEASIKKILNYPIVDEVINSHIYGYKVQKLRQRQKLKEVNSRRQNEDGSILQSNESYRYGSIV